MLFAFAAARFTRTILLNITAQLTMTRQPRRPHGLRRFIAESLYYAFAKLLVEIPPLL